MKSPVQALVVGPADVQDLAFFIVFNFDVPVPGHFEFALGAFDPDCAVSDLHLDAGAVIHRLFTDT